MYSLFAAHYLSESKELFYRDLSQKDWVILLRDGANAEICGFSSLVIYRERVDELPLSVVYSGDTLVKARLRNAPHLARAWIRAVLELTKHEPHPVYWLLLCGGYKTYRFLPLFFRTFFPRVDEPIVSDLVRIRTALCAKRFKEQFDERSGVVRFVTGATPLRPGVAEIGPQRLQNPHVQFFASQNPGWMQGDELACITSLAEANFTEAGKRMLR